ncbi:hypothetical protein XENORESO_000476 [Xenotaenia resolanae]|uniref:Uncharacterized protein n=1 Tax=Xenotaenia resolanae TaxID=208358 RepID=A0ABV0WBT5_9TELE
MNVMICVKSDVLSANPSADMNSTRMMKPHVSYLRWVKIDYWYNISRATTLRECCRGIDSLAYLVMLQPQTAKHLMEISCNRPGGVQTAAEEPFESVGVILCGPRPQDKNGKKVD